MSAHTATDQEHGLSLAVRNRAAGEKLELAFKFLVLRPNLAKLALDLGCRRRIINADCSDRPRIAEQRGIIVA